MGCCACGAESAPVVLGFIAVQCFACGALGFLWEVSGSENKIVGLKEKAMKTTFVFPFERLTVWHEAKEYAHLIYNLTRKFPDSERFGLTSQMRRAAISVQSNLAEGSSRLSKIEQARFTDSLLQPNGGF